MKLAIALMILTSTLASTEPQDKEYGGVSLSDWKPPGPNDARGPCPMLNTLANHGFIPHDGRNITEYHGVFALTTALNFNETFATLVWSAGLAANPEPNATFFTLEQISRHNVLEHDASLSRLDAYFGSNTEFNPEVFNQTTQYWTAPTLNAVMLANSKLRRQIDSRAFNPNYTFTSTAENFSLGEISSFVAVFGDLETGTANRTLVEWFFENERLPSALGWTKPSKAVSSTDVQHVSTLLVKALNYTTNVNSAPATRRRDLHSG